MPKLEVLNLENNRLDNQAIISLAPALQRLPKLSELSLCSNSIGDAGMQALLGEARGFQQLHVLDLSLCAITDVGCAALATALASGALPKITFIGLYGCSSISTEAWVALDAIVQVRRAYIG